MSQTLWLVLISSKGGYIVHSAHKDKITADQWAKCKEHDGDDTTIAELTGDALETVQRICETNEEEKT